jgi:hypothetical protein
MSSSSFQNGMEEVSVLGRSAASGCGADEASTQVQTLCKIAWYWVWRAGERERQRLPWWEGGCSSKEESQRMDCCQVAGEEER